MQSLKQVEQRQPFVGELLGRSDYAIIGEIVEPNARCWISAAAKANCWPGWRENKSVDARGVEISRRKVRAAIARGVSVLSGRYRRTGWPIIPIRRSTM